MNCNQVGTCDALKGLCTCPAGWRGFNCVDPMKRYCTHKYRDAGFEVPLVPANLSAGVGGPHMNMFPRGHCGGFCDYNTAGCYCPSNTTYGRVPAPLDAPPGAPPVKQGRPMFQYCQPNKMPDGSDTVWGTVDPEELYGPDGWCIADAPKLQCLCYLDGWQGPTCEERVEMFCLNQCNGRGECVHGYCKCHKGWHGIDCAHRSADVDDSSPSLVEERPWIQDFMHTPAAQDFLPGATRKRPLIYVYDLPSDYSTLMLQYRHGVDSCVPRYFGTGNSTLHSIEWVYMLETGFVEMLLQSEHRTLDPEEADFFYVPVFSSCFTHPVRDTADSLREFFYHVSMNRAQGAINMVLEAYHWIQSHHPYWDRRGGRDHIWLFTHDEGTCWAPAAIKNSIILGHWGRMDANHTSNTAYGHDNYSQDYQHPQFDPEGFQKKMAPWLPCYDPQKDLVMPLQKRPDHYHLSPLLGGATRERAWLAFHRGRVQFELPQYSRGIRQRVAKAAEEGRWREKHSMLVGEREDVEGDYSELLASSVFCLVMPGDGWSARMDDAMLHGCLPVIIMDEVHVSYESVVDISQFAIRVPEADADKLPEILLAVSGERREEMQRALARVWNRYAYSGYRAYKPRFLELQAQHAAARGDNGTAAQNLVLGQPSTASRLAPSLPEAVPDLNPGADDAFTTAMAWLYSRIPDTR
ncbi:exostosin-like glycosyltransferase [Micractinium conductrix]|uniref:Exostosin-like glycosyltransferase n=1 Tax=Micractinium conductrix TaxID=554055 RepID=A0A2P6VR19_9CHLO|nr:exostosin-like glycosyltransferase [Micractinium conductrix]|eukprot:PSC76549.1 exostosin-like glycosyltransferase [Micractinium conductrix]